MKKLFKSFKLLLTAVFVALLFLAACDADIDEEENNNGETEESVMFFVSANGSDTASTTELSILFTEAVPGLTMENINITNVSGEVNVGTPLINENDFLYRIGVEVVRFGQITVQINKIGVVSTARTVTVHDEGIIRFTVTPNGRENLRETTELNIEFNRAVPGLTMEDIIITGGSGEINAAPTLVNIDNSDIRYRIDVVVINSGYITIRVERGRVEEIARNITVYEYPDLSFSDENLWYVTVAPFAILEQITTNITAADLMSVNANNVVLSWASRGAEEYFIFRDGVFIGANRGATFEDYDLEIGRTFTYRIGRGNPPALIKSAPITFTAEVATATPGSWFYRNIRSNTNQASDQHIPIIAGTASPSGVQATDGRWYDTRAQVTGSSAGDGADRRLHFEYRWSENGMTGWSNWHRVPNAPGGTEDLIIGCWEGPVNGTMDDPSWDNYGVQWPTPASIIANAARGIKIEGVHWYNNHEARSRVLVCHRQPTHHYWLAHLMVVHIHTNGGNVWGEMTFSGRPFGNESRDQRFTFVDGVPIALTSAIGRQNWIEFDQNWRYPVAVVSREFSLPGQGARETPDMISIGNYIFFGSSAQNGWYPTQTTFSVSSTGVDGEWSPLVDIGNAVTFGSQFNGFASWAYGNGRRAYGFYSWRWSNHWNNIAQENAGNPRRLSKMAVNGSHASSAWFNVIAFYPNHGLIGIRPGRFLSLGKTVTAPPQFNQVGLQNLTDGIEVRRPNPAIATWHGGYTQMTFPHNLTVDLERPSIIREITLTNETVAGSDGSYVFTVDGSLDGITWTQIVDRSNNGAPGFVFTTVSDNNPYRFIRLNVERVRNSRNSNNQSPNIHNWDRANTIFQFAVYGSYVE
ncbi:MAG: discoidin domain-containing protein [Treponema sp.]|nr:discoidin domain-containing protein [Treponema sp.]